MCGDSVTDLGAACAQPSHLETKETREASLSNIDHGEHKARLCVAILLSLNPLFGREIHCHADII